MTGVQNSKGTANYTYKPDGLRHSKDVNGTVTIHVWEGQDIGLELDGNGKVLDRYIRGAGLIKSDKGGWYLFNAHGDVVQLTDGSGNVIHTYDYDAFGNEKDADGNDSNPFRYCGEYYDDETGDVYLRARYYDPEVGRFGSEDPMFDGINWYVYGNGNPVFFKDPTGYWAAGDEKLPQWAQDAIMGYTDRYNSANSKNARNSAHKGAESVRAFIKAGLYTSRKGWGAKPSKPGLEAITGDRKDYYDTIVFHHSNRPQDEDIKSTQRFFFRRDGNFADIGYHFVVGNDGMVYEGRSLEYVGAHVDLGNTGKIGISVMGNFEPTDNRIANRIQGAAPTKPTNAQINSAKQMALFLDAAYNINTIGGHKNFADKDYTDCPGSDLSLPLMPVYKLYTRRQLE